METPPPTDTKTNAYRELELFVAASLQGNPEIAGQASRCRETGDEGGVTTGAQRGARIEARIWTAVIAMCRRAYETSATRCLNALGVERRLALVLKDCTTTTTGVQGVKRRCTHVSLIMAIRSTLRSCNTAINADAVRWIWTRRFRSSSPNVRVSSVRIRRLLLDYDVEQLRPLLFAVGEALIVQRRRWRHAVMLVCLIRVVRARAARIRCHMFTCRTSPWVALVWAGMVVGYLRSV